MFNRLISKKFTFIIFLVSLIWVLSLLIVPRTLPKNSLKLGENGTVGKIEFRDKFENLSPYAKFIYLTGDLNCHQKQSRSYFINGNQMPYCSRDVGIFFGITISLGIVVIISVNVKLWWFLVGLIPISIDGTLQLFTSYESTNLVRLITGGIAGGVVGLGIDMVITEISKMFKLKKVEK